MTRDQVEETIRSYRTSLGCCAHIDVEIQRIEAQIGDPRLADRILIQLQAKSTPKNENDGSGRSNRVSRPTERQGIELAEAMDRYVELAKLRIQRLKADRERYSSEVMYVEAWLQILNEREKWIVQHQIIEAEPWTDVVEGYKRRFADPDASKNRLKYLKAKGLDRICESISACEDPDPGEETCDPDPE